MPHQFVAPLLVGAGLAYVILGLLRRRRGESLSGFGFVLVGMRYAFPVAASAQVVAVVGWALVIGGYLLKIKDDDRRARGDAASP